MKRNVNIHYGKEILTLQIKKEAIRHELKPADIKTVESISDELQRALRNPVNSEEINQLVKRGDKVVILADDITRLTPAREILPHVIN